MSHCQNSSMQYFRGCNSVIFAFLLSRGELLKERICSFLKSGPHFKELPHSEKQTGIFMQISSVTLFSEKRQGALDRAGAFLGLIQYLNFNYCK